MASSTWVSVVLPRYNTNHTVAGHSMNHLLTAIYTKYTIHDLAIGFWRRGSLWLVLVLFLGPITDDGCLWTSILTNTKCTLCYTECTVHIYTIQNVILYKITSMNVQYKGIVHITLHCKRRDVFIAIVMHIVLGVWSTVQYNQWFQEKLARKNCRISPSIP